MVLKIDNYTAMHTSATVPVGPEPATVSHAMNLSASTGDKYRNPVDKGRGRPCTHDQK